MDDWTKMHNCLKEATVAGYRLIGSLDKAIRRMSPETPPATKRALDDAMHDSRTSVAQLEDILFAEGSVEECIGMCDIYQALLCEASLECRDSGTVRNTLEDSNEKAFMAMCNLKSAVDGYRQIGDDEGNDSSPLQTNV